MAGPPHLNSLTPNSIKVNTEARIQLAGSRFTAGMTAQVNNQAQGTLEAITPTSATWVVKPLQVGLAQLRLKNPDGKQSNPMDVTVVAEEPPPEPEPGPEPEPLPPPGAYGPQEIAQPANAVVIQPGESIQAATDAHDGGTVFWLTRGTYPLFASIRPKSGNSYVGEYGAVLDGTGWTTEDDTAGAFRAHNEDIDYVTIRNLKIQNMPWRGIQAYYHMSDHWLIEHNEICGCKYGIEFGADFTIRNNFIHHNVGDPNQPAAGRGGGYVGQHADRTLFEHNEIAYNGLEQKVAINSVGVVWRNNWLHHNQGDGIWFDGCADAQCVIATNWCEDNGRTGITIEISSHATITNNILKRNAGDAILVSQSRFVTVEGNTLEGNFGGLALFFNCHALGEGFDLSDVLFKHNTVAVGSQLYAYAGGLSCLVECTEQLGPYLDGRKNLRYEGNAYTVPDATGHWYWGNVKKTWADWQAIPQDAGGSCNGQGGGGGTTDDFGPMATTKPTGAVELAPGSSIAQAAANHPEGTVFWIHAGVHQIQGEINPKSGQQFIGELGAVLDAAGWTPYSDSYAIFRGVETRACDVTIDNLVLRNCSTKGIYCLQNERNKMHGWRFRHLEIANCGWALVPPNQSVVEHCYIHDCRLSDAPYGGAYSGFGDYKQTVDGAPNVLDGIRFEHNRIEDCGQESHLVDVVNIVFRRNEFRRMVWAAMWNDGVGNGFIAEDNLVEDSAVGVHFEGSIGGIVRRNRFIRCKDNGVFCSTSRDMLIEDNDIVDCFRAISYFLNCGAIEQNWPWDMDLRNNLARANRITVPATEGAIATYMSYGGGCDLSAYAMPANQKNNRFEANHYLVPDVNGWYWLWATGGGMLQFAHWQALPQDAGATIAPRA